MLPVLALLAAPAQAECSTPIPTAMFQLKLDEIQAAIEGKNLKQLSQQLTDANESLPCIVQPLTPAQASQYHMLQGIYLWVERKPDDAQLHFSSAKAASPGASMPDSLFPKEHQVQLSFAKAPALDDSEKLRAPKGTSLWFDGTKSKMRPLYRPTVVQVVKGGQAQDTALLEAGAALPFFLVQTPVAQKSGKEDVGGSDAPPGEAMSIPDAPPLTAKQARTAGIAAAAGGLALYAAAFNVKTQHAEMLDLAQNGAVETGDAAIEAANAMKSRNAALYGTSLALGGAGLVLGGLSYTWER